MNEQETTHGRMCDVGRHLVRVTRGHLLDRDGNGTGLVAHVMGCDTCRRAFSGRPASGMVCGACGAPASCPACGAGIGT